VRQTTRGLYLAAVAGAVVLTAACSPEEAGAAALVGDRRITNEQLQSAVTDLREGSPDAAQVPQLDRLVLFAIIAEPYVLKAARDEGLGVSPSEAQAALPRSENPGPDAVRALQALIALNKLDQGQKQEALSGVATQLRDAGVRVSPRFGRFDPQAMRIVDAPPNWLVPAPKTPPTGAPAPGEPEQPAPAEPSEAPPGEAPATDPPASEAPAQPTEPAPASPTTP